MDTPTANYRQESIVYGDQRLYERLKGLRQFRIAPYDGVHLPLNSEFRPFEAYDYSRDGFSYWSHEKPTTELVIIELRYRNRTNYHEAKIAHFSEARREGIAWYLVGCRFHRRIETVEQNRSELLPQR
jgi:hypothetical protein